MAYNHGAMIPGARPVPRQTIKRKKILPKVDQAQPTEVELEPEVVKVIVEEETEARVELEVVKAKSEFKRGYNAFPNLGKLMAYDLADNSYPEQILDPIKEDDKITEAELEAEIVEAKEFFDETQRENLEDPVVVKKTRKKRARKKKSTVVS